MQTMPTMPEQVFPVNPDIIDAVEEDGFLPQETFEKLVRLYGAVLGAAQYAVDEKLIAVDRAGSFFFEPNDGLAHGYDIDEFVFALSYVEITGQAPTRWHQTILLRNELVEKRVFKVGPFESRTILMITARGRETIAFGTIYALEAVYGPDAVTAVMHAGVEENNTELLHDFILANEPLQARLPIAWKNDRDLLFQLFQFNDWESET